MQISANNSPATGTLVLLAALLVLAAPLLLVTGAGLPAQEAYPINGSEQTASEFKHYQHHHHHQQQQQPQLKDHRMQQQQQQQQQEPPAATISSKTEELHFGAKIALSILMAVILLVASATFVDLNSSPSATSGGSRQNQQQTFGCTNGGSHFSQAADQAGQLGGQRDQRSPSLSSSSSSTLFSSANSVSSASAPILAHGGSTSVRYDEDDDANDGALPSSRRADELGSRANWIKRLACAGAASVRKSSHYSNNLRFNGTTGKQGDKSIELARKQEASLAAAVLKAESRWRHHRASSGPQPPEKPLLLSRQLARQVFLSFSLRHSASLIFETSPQNSGARGQRSDQSQQQQQRTANKCAGVQRSRLSSLSSLNTDTMQRDHILQDDANCPDCSTATNGSRMAPSTGGRLESIDSLHGLRFLSMIWLIVTHSYSFALSWLFFTNSSTLEDIYKTAASQLLANGSFACDSFFFASGFLLPYLAFPAYKPKQQEVTTTTTVARSPPPAAVCTATTTTTSPTKSKQQCKQDNSYHNNNHHHHQAQQARSSSPERAESDRLSSSGCLDSRQSAACYSCHLAPHHNQQQLDQNQNIASSTSTTTTTRNSCCTTQQPNVNSQNDPLHTNEFTLTQVISNILHRYIRMMPLMMAIIGLSTSLLRYMGEGPAWDDSTMMFDKWCRNNWWINALFLHNFLKRENMCLSHSWYSAVDIQLFLLGQLILFILFRSKKLGILLLCTFLVGAQLLTGALTLIHHLPAVPLIASFSEQSMNLYYGEIYIKPYCRASPYLIGILLAYLMRTSSLSQVRLNRWQVTTGWTLSIGTHAAILMAMQPAMNGQVPSELQSALYSSLSRPLWACATGWMIFACMTKHGGIFATVLSARCFVPLSRLTYPAFLIHPIVMAVFYGSRQTSFHFSHYLMLYLILGNIVITYAIAFILAALFELPIQSVERAVKRALNRNNYHGNTKQQQASCK